MPRQREAETEASELTSLPCLRLPETLEDVWHGLGRYPDARVAHHQVCAGPFGRDDHLDAAPGRCELDGIGQQVPHDLPEPIGIPDDLDAWFDAGIDRDPLD